MRRASVITQQMEHEDVDENGDMENNNTISKLTIPCVSELGLPSSKSFSNFCLAQRINCNPKTEMSSRPSFISLMLIASDDELSRLPRLPAPLQVESDTYQKCGWEDEPKVCSHLPVLHPPESDDECEPHGVFQSIIHLPDSIRKISADRQRFNVYALPDQERKQLKNMYVY